MSSRGPASAGPSPSRGLVALGDSITNGAGEAMLGLRMQSWAQWLAQALELPFTGLARDGARARDALATQVPRLHGPYDLGCVYIGVNDVRAPDWDLHSYGESLQALVAAVAASSRVQLLVKLPQAIGRPPAPTAAIGAANALIASLATRHGALALEQAMPTRGLVLPDAVHLTARGQARLAREAGAELERAGFTVQARELEEALAPLSHRARLRYELGQGAAAQLRDWRRRAREQASRTLAARRA